MNESIPSIGQAVRFILLGSKASAEDEALPGWVVPVRIALLCLLIGIKVVVVLLLGISGQPFFYQGF